MLPVFLKFVIASYQFHHHQVSLQSPVTLEQHGLEAGVAAELGHLLLHAELDPLLLV